MRAGRVDLDRFLVVALLAAGFGLAAAACSPGGGGDRGPETATDDAAADLAPGTPDTSAPLEITRFSTVENPSNTLSRFVEWRTNRPASGELRAECAGRSVARASTSGRVRRHEAFVMGFWEGASCTLTLRVDDGAGTTKSRSKSVEFGDLPDFLPNLAVPVSKPDSMQEGWTIVNLNNAFDNVPLILAAIDAEGRYRWYHERSASGSGAATSVTPVDGGLLVGGTHDSGRIWPAVIEWDGELAWEAKLKMHHDIRPWKGDAVLYLDHASDCDKEGVGGSSAVVAYDRSSEKSLWRWALCDHYKPPSVWPDWDHTNAIEPFPGKETILTSSRSQSALFKFEIDSGKLLWKLGKKGDFTRTDNSSDLAFLRQHAPEIQPDGNILLFDNGGGGRPYSRAVEIAYDDDAMTFHVDWTYRPQPDIYAPIWGDADRLDNGNTLVVFGRRDKSKGSVLQEVKPDGTVVWELRVPKKWGWYRAVRLAPPASATSAGGE